MTDPSVLAKRLPLGKKPGRPSAMKFKLTNFANLAKLPKPPKVIGHLALQKQPWGLFSNDKVGDCAWAGAANETMAWFAEAGKTVTFTDASVVGDYAAQTGYDPKQTDADGNNPTDQGTDMLEAASYRRKTGILDSAGNRHTVDAYLSLKVGDLDQLKVALYLFGMVGVGIRFPASAYDQFDKGQVWTPVARSKLCGGHYMPLGGFDGTNFRMITWGKEVRVSPAFLKKYMDEAIAYIDLSRLTNGKSLDGFDVAALRASLAALPSS